MSTIKAKLIECLINTHFELKPIETQTGYKVKLSVDTECEVSDLAIEVLELIQTGENCISPSSKKKFTKGEGVLLVDNLSKQLVFYTKSPSPQQAIKDVLSYIRIDYDESVAEYNKTKTNKHAGNANKLVKLYTSLKIKASEKGVA